MTYRLGEGARESPSPPPVPAPGLGARLRPLAPGLVDEAVDAIRRRAEGDEHPLDPEHVEAVRQVITTGVHAFLERVEHGTDAEGHTALGRAFHSFGAGEAGRGRGLECLHTGKRTSAAVAWRRLARTRSLDREDVAALGEAIFAFEEEAWTAASEGYARARGVGMEALRRRRSRLLEALLAESGAEPEPGALASLARAARWRLPDRVAVAVLHQGGPEGAPAPALPSDVLVDLERSEPCALVPDPEGPGRSRSLERSLRGFGAVLGPAVPPARAWESLERARELAGLVRSRMVPGDGVLRWDEHLTELLLSRGAELVAAMARLRLAPLAGMREPQRGRMADTLLAWLESGFNASEAAERLRIHPQTARYRIRRLKELFGPDLHEPTERFELELVLRSRHLLDSFDPQ